MSFTTSYPPFDPLALMPSIRAEPLEGKLAAQTEVATYMIDDPPRLNEYIQHAWMHMYERIAEEVAKAVSGRDDFVALRFHPSVHVDYTSTYGSIKLLLQAEVYRSKTAHIIVPKMVYDDTVYPSRIIEWRCGSCTSPNRLLDRHCTQCGAPRALLTQEVETDTAYREWRCQRCLSPNQNPEEVCSQCGGRHGS